MAAEASPVQRWRWVDLLGGEVTRIAGVRRTLLGWAGSITAAVALIVWTIIALLEMESASNLLAFLLMLVIVSIFGVRLVAALYPAGIGGLVDKVVGTDSGSDSLEPEVLIDFIRLNVSPLRSLVLKGALADLFLVGVLALVGAVVPPASGGPQGLIWVLAILRLIVFMIVVAFTLLVLSPSRLKVLTDAIKGVKEARAALEKNPRLLALYLKFVALERVGSIAWNSLYYGLQVLAAVLLVTAFGGASFNVIRLMLLAFVASLLSAIVWELWKTAHVASVQIDYFDGLRMDILLKEIPTDFEREYEDTRIELQKELAEPFKLPQSYWSDSTEPANSNGP